MRNRILILICILAFSSCIKEKENPINPIVEPDPIPWTPVTPAELIIDRTTMPLISSDRQEIKRHLKTLAAKVSYTKLDGVWIIEAKFNKDESAIFSSIRYEMISDGDDLINFDMNYVFKESISKEDKEKVYKFISENSKIYL